MSDCPKILTSIEYYLPGYKAGGAVRTLVNMVDKMSEKFIFKIITRDRDLGDIEPYSNVKEGSWNKFKRTDVFYVSRKNATMKNWRQIIQKTEHDIQYFNSFFSPLFTLKPLFLRWLRLIPRSQIIIAPRGEFSPGALKIKRIRKRFFIIIVKLLGIYRGVIWQASNLIEKNEITKLFKEHNSVIIASDLSLTTDSGKMKSKDHIKTSGSLKIIFLSRISRNKNLDGALRMLYPVQGNIEFNIYGYIEDVDHWKECQRIIKKLPPNIKVQYHGSVEHENVLEVMMENELFFFPTLGENFGHVILEALVTGCPVLISDQTPWKDLENKGLGWDLPLDAHRSFRRVLSKFVEMDDKEYQCWSQRARKFGLQFCINNNRKNLQKNFELFYRVFKNKTKIHNKTTTDIVADIEKNTPV